MAKTREKERRSGLRIQTERFVRLGTSLDVGQPERGRNAVDVAKARKGGARRGCIGLEVGAQSGNSSQGVHSGEARPRSHHVADRSSSSGEH